MKSKKSWESTILLKLTKREKNVLRLIMLGKTNVEIARHLFLSPRTIESFAQSLREKTGTKNRTELADYARKYKLCTVD